MKKLLVVFTAVLFLFSCSPEVTNTPETLDAIFEAESFQLKVNTHGCFGGEIDIYTITNKEGETLIENRNTGTATPISPAKIDSLKNYLSTRIGQEFYGGCTSHTTISAETFFKAVNFHHSYCGGKDVELLNDILGTTYYER